MSRPWTRFSVRSVLLLVALACVYLGFISRHVQRQKEAEADLRRLGAQLELSQGKLTAVTWFSGDTTSVREVHFLGPNVGDETIDTIVKAASWLPELERMTFTETRVSGTGTRELKSNLPNLEIKVFMPVLAPLNSTFRRH